MAEKQEKVTGMKSINLTNKELINKFYPSFVELTKVPSNTKTGRLKYAIKRSINSIQDALENYQEARNEIFESRCKLDGDGNPVMGEDKSYTFDSSDIRKEAISEAKKLENKEITLTIYPINKSNIEEAIGSLSIGLELNLEGFILSDEE